MLDSFSGNNTGQRFKREGKRIRQLGSHIYKLSIKARGSKLNAGQVGVLSISDLFACIEESIGALCFGGGAVPRSLEHVPFQDKFECFQSV